MNKYIESVILPHLIAIMIVYTYYEYITINYQSIFFECIKIVNTFDINYMKVYYISKNLLLNKYGFRIVNINPLRIKKVID